MKKIYSKIALIISLTIIFISSQDFQSVFALNESEGLSPIYASGSQKNHGNDYNFHSMNEDQIDAYSSQSSSNQTTVGWVYNNENWYFFDDDGIMKTGWIFNNNNWYFLDASGKMKTGWFTEDDEWYYLMPTGEMARGWLLEGNWYYMDPSGRMLTKLHKIDGVWYFFKSNGVLSEDKSMVDMPGTFVDDSGNIVTYEKMLSGSCTAYTASPGAITSIGLAPQVGYVAVDPDIIPYGTKMYICSEDGSVVYGYATAADTGGAMLSGRRLIDLYYDTEHECIQFGVRHMNVYILS